MGLREMLSRDAGNYAALDGVRAAMCVWMIVFHSFFWVNYFINKEQLDLMLEWPLLRVLVLPGYIAVDFFFVLTGFLLSGSLFRKAQAARSKARADAAKGVDEGVSGPTGAEEDKSVVAAKPQGGSASKGLPRVHLRNWVYRRSMRVLPMLAVGLLIWCFVLFPEGTFPVSTVKAESTLELIDRHFANATHLPNGCNTSPANLLFLNNLLPFGGCMGYTWTLAVQFHFYLLLPLLWNFTSIKTLIRVCFGAILLGAILRGYAMYQMVDLVPNSDELGFFAFFWYSSTVTRIGCIFYGVLLAYGTTMHKMQDWFRARPALVWLCWAVGVVFMYLARRVDFGTTLSSPLQTLPEMFVSTVLHPGGIFMGAGITFMVLSVHHSIGPIGAALNRLFSMPFWAPIAELSYIAYLLHPMVMQKAYQTIFYPISSSGTMFTFYAIFNVVVTLSCALVLHLCIDAPLQRLLGRKAGTNSFLRRWAANLLFGVYMLVLLATVFGHASMLYLVAVWTGDDEAAAAATAADPAAAH